MANMVALLGRRAGADGDDMVGVLKLSSLHLLGVAEGYICRGRPEMVALLLTPANLCKIGDR